MFNSFRIKELISGLVLSALLFHAPTDFDFPWHLRYGEEILNTGSAPTSNSYSYSLPDYVWADSYWLSEAIMAKLNSFGPYYMVPLVFSLILGFSMVFIGRNLGDVLPARYLALLFGVLGMMYLVVSIRPLMFSTLFLLILWFGLRSSKYKTCLLFMPLMFLAWANFHVDFMIGLGIFSTFWAIMSFNAFRIKKYSEAGLLTLSLFASYAVTLINPYGFNLHKTFLNEVFTMSTQSRFITEWQPVQFHLSPVFYIYAICLLVIIGWVYMHASTTYHINYGPSKVFFHITLLVTAAFALKSAYFFRILIIVSLPLIYSCFEHLLSFVKSNRFKMQTAFFLILLFSILTSHVIVQFEISRNLKNIADFSGMPYDAVQYIKLNPPSGKMLNAFNWGGFLIYALPEHKTFIDGRMPSWHDSRGVSIFDEYRQVALKPSVASVKPIISKYNFGWALLPANHPLGKVLKTDLDWQLIYQDPIAIILVNPAAH